MVKNKKAVTESQMVTSLLHGRELEVGFCQPAKEDVTRKLNFNKKEMEKVSKDKEEKSIMRVTNN